MTDNDMVKRLAWAGLLAGVGAAGFDRHHPPLRP